MKKQHKLKRLNIEELLDSVSEGETFEEVISRSKVQRGIIYKDLKEYTNDIENTALLAVIRYKATGLLMNAITTSELLKVVKLMVLIKELDGGKGTTSSVNNELIALIKKI